MPLEADKSYNVSFVYDEICLSTHETYRFVVREDTEVSTQYVNISISFEDYSACIVDAY